jgi:outer membrane biogenesis lipoprotein LolB
MKNTPARGEWARRALAVAAGAGAWLAGCAPPPIVWPAGPAAPFPEFREAARAARPACEHVHTWTAELAIGGRAGATRLRGRVLAGFARPDRVRLEGVAPFGQPLFILVAAEDQATLWLPRDRQVLRHPSAAAIMAALTGVALEPDALLDLLTGCVARGEATAGRAYPNGWYAVDLDTTATAYLRRTARSWRVVGGARQSVAVEYREYDHDRPRAIRLRTVGAPDVAGAAGSEADLSVRLAQVAVNVSLAPEAFRVDVPADAVPLTIEELRGQGPLGVRRSSARASGVAPGGGRAAKR